MIYSSFSSKTHTSNDIMELVHTDLCGPIGVDSYYGDRYFILFMDDYSSMMIVFFMKVKSHTFDVFKWYKERVEKEIGKPLKWLRSGRGGKFMSIEFTNFCVENGIKR